MTGSRASPSPSSSCHEALRWVRLKGKKEPGREGLDSLASSCSSCVSFGGRRTLLMGLMVRCSYWNFFWWAVSKACRLLLAIGEYPDAGTSHKSLVYRSFCAKTAQSGGKPPPRISCLKSFSKIIKTCRGNQRRREQAGLPTFSVTEISLSAKCCVSMWTRLPRLFRILHINAGHRESEKGVVEPQALLARSCYPVLRGTPVAAGGLHCVSALNIRLGGTEWLTVCYSTPGGTAYRSYTVCTRRRHLLPLCLQSSTSTALGGFCFSSNMRIAQCIPSQISCCQWLPGHLLHVLQVFLTERYVCIVMEYAPGGSLSKFLSTNVLSEDGARFFFQQLIFAVRYCHHMVSLFFLAWGSLSLLGSFYLLSSVITVSNLLFSRLWSLGHLMLSFQSSGQKF